MEAGRWTPTAHNMQNFEVVVVDDKEVLEIIGNVKSRISEVFLRENYEQLSFSKEELHGEEDWNFRRYVSSSVGGSFENG